MENTESINGEKSLQLPSHVLPRMRFLHYSDSGGKMEPHVDLSKNHIYYQQGEINVDFNGKPNLAIESTFTFILHLHDCNDGGETVFLKKLGKVTFIDLILNSPLYFINSFVWIIYLKIT